MVRSTDFSRWFRHCFAAWPATFVVGVVALEVSGCGLDRSGLEQLQVPDSGSNGDRSVGAAGGHVGADGGTGGSIAGTGGAGGNSGVGGGTIDEGSGGMIGVGGMLGAAGQRSGTGGMIVGTGGMMMGSGGMTSAGGMGMGGKIVGPAATPTLARTRELAAPASMAAGSAETPGLAGARAPAASPAWAWVALREWAEWVARQPARRRAAPASDARTITPASWIRRRLGISQQSRRR